MPPNFDPDDFYLSVPNPAQYTVILPDRPNIHRKTTRVQLIRKYSIGFLLGFILCLIVFVSTSFVFGKFSLN
ncbi:Protein CBG27284 [Caenorhabditis briggsae]|uniref:Protein CBG27284 n=1 Tax=Caenorhabditis briggsae TaxID=6238 RepID=B6IJX2_CAEBR|nr:Protein CBG27284 [Caenorhabditis briggsae]CAS00202.1 Protein CBG27284 [Caenorhabditis briggsae]